MDIKKKIYYSFDLSLFLSGILLILLSVNGKSTVDIRAIIGEISIFTSYFLFPFIDIKKKDKIFQTFSIHIVLFVASIFIAYFSLNIYIKNVNGAVWWQEILAALGIIGVISYLSYILINFIRSFYILSSKLISFLLGTNVKETYSNAKKIIEKITALIVTITALAASITALIASFSNMIGG